MATGGEIVDNGRNLALNRIYKAVPDYTAVNRIKLGVGTTTPTTSDIDVENGIPIAYGTINDNGDNQMIGSSGADNSTDNNTTYKPGGGVADDTAQNLIANNTNSLKIWTIADLSVYGTILDADERIGHWIYIKDAPTLAKFKSSGTCFEVKFGIGISDYYSITKTAADLATGWNWITSNDDNLSDLTETGTVSGDIDYFIIEITTNNATDTFAAGDVIYDLLRQWVQADMLANISTGYPTFDTVNKEVTAQFYIHSLQANGYPLTECGSFTNDTTPEMMDHDVYTAVSKGRTDEMIITITNTMS